MRLILSGLPSVERRNISENNNNVKVYCTVYVLPEKGDTLEDFHREVERLKQVTNNTVAYSRTDGGFAVHTGAFVALDMVRWDDGWIPDADAVCLGLENKLGAPVEYLND